jgi:hypothetical protein
MKTDEGATAIVEMLFCTSLVALVSAGDKPSASPRRLQIVNTKVGSKRMTFIPKEICLDHCS